MATLLYMAYAMPRVQQIHNLENKNRIAGEFLIVLGTPSPSTKLQYASSVADKFAEISSKIVIVKRFTNLRTPIFLIKTTDESVINDLFQLQEVRSIEANVFVKRTQECATQDTGSRLWGLSRISSVPLPNFEDAEFSYGLGDGSGVRVYVLDTGIRLTHQEFGERAEFGFNTIGGKNPDLNGHGTHCAGTVGGTEYGVAKAATLVAVKVLNDFGGGTEASIVEGINFSVWDMEYREGRAVLSMSIGGPGSFAIDSAVNSADAVGIPVVTAAANSRTDACFFSPGRAPAAINVGATDITDTLAWYSNWGICVDILAPGTDILSAWYESDNASTVLSGTSMACPHVAGVVAKYLSANPSASTAEVKSFLSSTATKDAIDVRSGTPNLLVHTTC